MGRRAGVLVLDPTLELLAAHGDASRGVDPAANLVAFHAWHRDADVLADHHDLA